MKHYLLDTNVISELVKPKPDTNVIQFLSTIESAWLSTITLHEITYGLELLPSSKRRVQLEEKVQQLLSEYSHYILPVNEEEANQAAMFRALVKRQGRILHLADSLIAGTAKTNNMTIATRNTSDFSGVEVTLLNPWEIEN